MRCTQCGQEHPWFMSECGAVVEYSDDDRRLRALLEGPEGPAIFSWLLDGYLRLEGTPRSGGPKENVEQWLNSLEIVPRGSIEATKSYYQWCRDNDQEMADPRDIAEEFERVTGRNLAESLMI